MKKIEIKGKVVLVTGANRGMGKEYVIELIAKGAKKVYAGARDIDTLQALVELYGERVVPIKLDVTNDADIEAAKEQIADIEILINNAGILTPGGFTQGDLMGVLQSNMDVNVFGIAKLTKAMLPTLLKKKEAAVVTVSSMAGLGNMPIIMSYSVTKAAVHSLIQGLRAELKDSNILVMGVYPGPIQTDMVKDFGMENIGDPVDVVKEVIEGIESGLEDVFPDPMSKKMGELYQSSPKEVERQFGGF